MLSVVQLTACFANKKNFYILDKRDCTALIGTALIGNMTKTRVELAGDCDFVQNVFCRAADPYGCA